MFDTLEGFDDRDYASDKAFSNIRDYSGLKNTSVQLVSDKLPHPENAVVKKGYFLESAKDVDSKFVFVNLDFDLYSPIKAGLEFFGKNGVWRGNISS